MGRNRALRGEEIFRWFDTCALLYGMSSWRKIPMKSQRRWWIELKANQSPKARGYESEVWTCGLAAFAWNVSRTRVIRAYTLKRKKLTADDPKAILGKVTDTTSTLPCVPVESYYNIRMKNLLYNIQGLSHQILRRLTQVTSWEGKVIWTSQV